MHMLRIQRAFPSLLIWASGALALYLLDGQWSLGNLALLLVLCSVLASYWLDTLSSLLLCAVAVAAFNWFLVEPRHTFHVQLQQDLLLLFTLWVTGALISVVTTQLRQSAQIQAQQAKLARRLQLLAAAMQQATHIEQQTRVAEQLLAESLGAQVHIWLNDDTPDPSHPQHRAWQASQAETGPVGPGTGRHESVQMLAWPLLAGVIRIGTLIVESGVQPHADLAWSLDQIHPLVRLVADEIHRLQTRQQAWVAQELIQTRTLQNTLLTAIAHDFRTPLATISGAASGLLASDTSSSDRHALEVILHEVDHLNRVTRNTLELARLDALGVLPQVSWESVEELCGVALSAAQRRHPDRRILSRIEAGLPLVRCDPVLLIQLLDNLLQNALIYSKADQAVEIEAMTHQATLTLQVLDRGPGISAEWRNRVFEPFMRVLPDRSTDAGFDVSERRGMGLGLALCRAIARLHRAELVLLDREGGGTIVQLALPIEPQPDVVPEVATIPPQP
jgi:two-component system sensor histidine kinase KdpD